jgi:hypothetical protein
MDLALAKHQVEAAFGALDTESDWWSNASNVGLVQAGLNVMARWLTKADH